MADASTRLTTRAPRHTGGGRHASGKGAAAHRDKASRYRTPSSDLPGVPTFALALPRRQSPAVSPTQCTRSPASPPSSSSLPSLFPPAPTSLTNPPWQPSPQQPPSPPTRPRPPPRRPRRPPSPRRSGSTRRTRLLPPRPPPRRPACRPPRAHWTTILHSSRRRRSRGGRGEGRGRCCWLIGVRG
jgi:hypothetical protein